MKKIINKYINKILILTFAIKLTYNTYKLIKLHSKGVYLLNLKFIRDREKIKSDKELIEKIEDLSVIRKIIDINLNKLYFFINSAVAIAIIIISIYLFINLYGRVNQTDIYVDIVLKELYIKSSDNLSLKSQPPYVFSTHDSIDVNVVNAPNDAALNSGFTNLDSFNSEPISIKFSLPEPSDLLINASSPELLNLKILPLNTNVNFEFSITGNQFQIKNNNLSQVVEKIVQSPKELIGKTQEVNIDLYNPAPYKFVLQKINNIYFSKTDNEGKEMSLVTGGNIRLKDTNGDSITLFSDDRVSIMPISPLKVLIRKEEEGLRIQFSATVTKLEVSSVYGEDVKNYMPPKIKTTYDKSPYYWLIILSIIPFLFGFFKSNK